MRAGTRLGGLAVLASLCASPTHAEDCTLQLKASLDMLGDEGDVPVVDIDVDGTPRRFIMDVGAVWSWVRPQTAAGYDLRAAPIRMVGASGGSLDKLVRLKSVVIGNLAFSNAEFFVTSDGRSGGSVAGGIGTNIFRLLDLEIDPQTRKVLFFSQDHCKGAVVHWKHGVMAAVPFTATPGLVSLIVPVQLNGQTLRAKIDTGASFSVLYDSVARSRFDLDTDGGGLEPIGPSMGLDGPIQLSGHRFEGLDLGGVLVRNPMIAIAKTPPRGAADHDMILGMHQLAALHLFFAFKERMLYVSSVRDDIVAQGGKPGPAAQQAGGQATGGAASTASAHTPDALDRVNATDLLREAGRDVAAYKYDQATTKFDRAVSLRPDDPEILAARARFRAFRRDFAGALADLDHAVTANPKLAAPRVHRGQFYLVQGNVDAAFKDFDEAVRIEPGNTRALCERSVALSRLGRRDEALRDADAALRLDPNAPNLLNNRCWLRAHMEQYQAALADCDAAIKLAPKDANILDSRGYTNLRAGRYKEAIADYDNALELHAGSASALYGRGTAKRQSGDPKGGDADIAAAQKLDPRIAVTFGL